MEWLWGEARGVDVAPARLRHGSGTAPARLRHGSGYALFNHYMNTRYCLDTSLGTVSFFCSFKIISFQFVLICMFVDFLWMGFINKQVKYKKIAVARTFMQ
jgi:hypothetical protein